MLTGWKSALMGAALVLAGQVGLAQAEEQTAPASGAPANSANTMGGPGMMGGPG
ncbi:MAG: hypothetical protein HQL56_15595, partial [Magnetococcales bacterium]|nr:hypothetical protein [Magnetococcales bacterium]